MKEIIIKMVTVVTDEQYKGYGKKVVEDIKSGEFDKDMMSSENMISNKTTVEVKEIDEGQ